MNEVINIKNEDKSIERKLQKLSSKYEIIVELLDKAFWLSSEKREAIKMMIDIFMEFGNELAKKKGLK